MANSKSNSPDESLLDKVRRLQTETANTIEQQRRSAKYSRTERVRQDLATTGKFLYQATAGLHWLHKYIWRPIYKQLKKLVFSIWKLYKRFWFFVVYKRDNEGVLLFSKVRAGIMILASVSFIWFLLIPTAQLTMDSILYLLTAKVNENIYLLGSQEIDPETGMHNVEGCTELPCSNRDAIYFRTTDSWFNNLWSISHGNGLFYPDLVGAAVPYSTSKCVVTAYGIRQKFLFRLVNLYSYLLAVECTPISQ